MKKDTPFGKEDESYYPGILWLATIVFSFINGHEKGKGRDYDI